MFGFVFYAISLTPPAAELSALFLTLFYLLYWFRLA